MEVLKNLVSNQSLFIAIVTTVWLAYAEPRIQEMIDETTKHQKGGLGSELCEELGVKRNKLAQKIAHSVNSADSLEKFRVHLLPMLQDELRTIDVGIKVDVISRQVRYHHTDGLTYYPVMDTVGMYKFMNSSGKMELCK